MTRDQKKVQFLNNIPVNTIDNKKTTIQMHLSLIKLRG